MHPGATRRTPLWTAIAVALAVLVAGARLAAAGSGGSSFEQGRLVGLVLGGPIILGVIVWAGIWLVLRRRDAAQRFVQNGLVITVAVFVIIGALGR